MNRGSQGREPFGDRGILTALRHAWRTDEDWRDLARADPVSAGRKLGLRPEAASRTVASLLLEERAIATPSPGKGLRQTLVRIFDAYAERRCLGRITANRGRDEAVEWWSYRRVWESACRLGSELRRRVGDGGVVVIAGDTSREWLIADLACVLHGLVSVPLHEGLAPRARSAILEQTGATAAICDQRAAQKLSGSSALEHVVTWGKAARDRDTARDGLLGATFEGLLREGREPLALPRGDQPDRVLSIVHTGGSSGPPKGVILTARRVAEHLASIPEDLVFRVYLASAPLGLLAERKNVWASLRNGGRVALWRGKPRSLFADLAVVRPTWVNGPPGFWTLLHREHRRAAAARSVAPADGDAWRALLGVAFRCLLGGRARLLINGGAPIAPEVVGFLRECFAARVVDGYGATEVGAIAVDGLPVADVELVDCPELGYRASDRPHPRGELRVRLGHAEPRYFGDDGSASGPFRDGWFHTGDLARMVGGRLELIGRRTLAVKMASGEFLAPDRVESLLGLDPWVREVFVYAEPGWTAPAAVVVPTPSARAASASDTDLERRLLGRLHGTAARAGLRAFEAPCALVLRRRRLTPARSSSTSAKLDRPGLVRCYRAKLRRAYRTALAERGRRPTTPAMLAAALSDPPDVDAPLDSLAAMELGLVVEQLYGHDAREEASAAAGRSLTEVAGYLTGSSHGWSGRGGSLADSDMQLDPDILPIRGGRLPGARAGAVLLTGATGFLGAHLLAELLTRRQGAVYCLVRADSPGSAIQRLRDAFQRFRLDGALLQPGRVHGLPGDLGADRLGLSDYERLTHDVAEILHAGAEVDARRDYRAHRASNVRGTLSVLRLAVSGRPKPVSFISSVSVLEANERGVSRALRPDGLDGYSASKWVAEDLVQQAAERGLDVTVFRPGLITAHSRSGVGKGSDLASLFLSAVLATGTFPADVAPSLEVVPVDYVAGAIERLRGRGGIFHLTAVPPRLEYPELISYLNPGGRRLRGVPFTEWRDQVRGLAVQGRLPAVALAPLVGPSFPSPWAIPCPETVAALSPVDTGLLQRARLDRAAVEAATAFLARGTGDR